MAGSYVLHPSLLIASGFESLSSRDVRFLNAYKKHFGSEADYSNKPIILSEDHFALGGILNPFDLLHDPHRALMKSRKVFASFPYTTLLYIKEIIYLPTVQLIHKRIDNEVLNDLKYEAQIKKIHVNSLTSLVIRNRPTFNKIAALHTCGLGLKLKDTIDLYLEQIREKM